MLHDAIHKEFMDYALQISEEYKGTSLPAPHVGCILTNLNNEIIGQGCNEYYHHTNAIKNAFNSMISKKNMNIITNNSILNNVYITLEPDISDIDLLITYRPKNVYIGIYNPNPSFASRVYKTLIDKGINTIIGLYKDKIKESLKYYIHYHKSRSPFFTGKIAMYMNNIYTNGSREKFLVYNEKSQKDNHKLRSNSNGILVGSNTWLLDNPNLNIGYNYKSCYNYTIFVIDNHLKFINCYDTNISMDNIIYICFNLEYQSRFGHLMNVLFCKNIDDLKNKMYDIGIVHCIIEGGRDTLNRFSSVIDEFIYYINLNYKNNINNINFEIEKIANKQLFNFNRNLKVISTENFDNILKVLCYPY